MVWSDMVSQSVRSSGFMVSSGWLWLMSFPCASEWAILIPSWTVIVVLLTYVTYFALALRATPGFDEMSAVTGPDLFSLLCDVLTDGLQLLL